MCILPSLRHVCALIRQTMYDANDVTVSGRANNSTSCSARALISWVLGPSGPITSPTYLSPYHLLPTHLLPEQLMPPIVCATMHAFDPHILVECQACRTSYVCTPTEGLGQATGWSPNSDYLVVVAGVGGMMPCPSSSHCWAHRPPSAPCCLLRVRQSWVSTGGG
jgi:hypothetical protein